MKISLNWLRDLVKLPEGVEKEIGYLTTLKIAEVENVTSQEDVFANIIIGKITAVNPHPNADKLRLADVDTGDGTETVVCGAPNIEAGQTIALARPGAVIDGTELKPAKIRGVKSAGMILSERELGLSTDHSGVMVIKEDIKPGTPFAEALGFTDTVIDIDNHAITHRPDLWCHRGLAREYAALFSTPLPQELPKALKPKEGSLTIDIDAPDLCSRYVGARIENISMGDSPDWMQKRLLACGVRPISNIVDITNYVMLDVGEPLHAFDADKVKDNHIIVRRAKDGEVLRTLDGQDRELTSTDLVIADPEKAVALAGVMGGENTEISDTTSTIILEAAAFNHVSIRHTRSHTGLQSEATNRFEKGLVPEIAGVAVNRTISLINELIPEAEVTALVDVNLNKQTKRNITVTERNIQRVTGENISLDDAAAILTSLGFTVSAGDTSLSVDVPYWRYPDTSIEVDLIEDIARHYGLDKITPVLPEMPITPAEESSLSIISKRIANILAGAGANEVSTYSFVPEQTLGLFSHRELEHFELENTLDSNMKKMRRTMLPGLMEGILKNVHLFDTAAIFEIGRIYEKKTLEKEDLMSNETTFLSLMNYKRGADVIYYDTLALADTLFTSLGMKYNLKRISSLPDFNPGRTAEIEINGTAVGVIGEIRQDISDKMKIKERVGVLELNMDLFCSMLAEFRPPYSPVPRFPAITREFSVICSENLDFSEISKSVDPVDERIRDIEILKIYQGDPIPETKKSVSFKILIRDNEATMSDEDANAIQDKVLGKLKKDFGISLREA